MKQFFKENYKIIIICLSVLVVAGVGSIFVNLGMDWYAGLTKPTEWIPNFVIPLVWSVIYLIFPIILSILSKQNLLTKKTIYLCVFNGIFNVLWCLVFFTLNQLFIGNIIIIINAFIGVLLLVSLSKTDKRYISLLWLYVIWLLVATSLNLTLWILN